MSYPEPLTRLVDQLKKLPGIGAKSAQRLAFHILRTPREEADRLCDAIRDVKERVTYCSICNNITDADPCGFCGNDARDHRVITLPAKSSSRVGTQIESAGVSITRCAKAGVRRAL